MGDLSESFSRSEFICKCGCERDTVDSELVWILQEIRDHFLASVSVNSGHRCPTYNKKVGGSKNSQHLYGRAADIVVNGVSASKVQDWFLDAYPFQYGMGVYENFTHIDTRSGPPARWGDKL